MERLELVHKFKLFKRLELFELSEAIERLERFLILWRRTAGLDFLAFGTEARIGIGFRSAAQENIAGVAWRFLLVILTLGDDDQHTWSD